jgi:hypothetical protein
VVSSKIHADPCAKRLDKLLGGQLSVILDELAEHLWGSAIDIKSPRS